MVFGFFWIPQREIQKNEAELLAVGPNFDGNFYDFVSFWALFWPRHLSIIFKLLLLIYPNCAYYRDVFFGTPPPQNRSKYQNVMIIGFFHNKILRKKPSR